ncbi:MAG: twin-arginine translocase TatA/TatE family subunit [Smithellaceae bacterium]|nr:twin-arginine translocase TatA/TatE family subunit [Smithellaceae bacterium]NLX52444.1 twin-arginine translocase TatA/TatE family subunit [Deltaproteobacteria bacterium]
MFGIGVPELLIILVIILVIFGAGKLPQIGSALGKGIHNFKKTVSDTGEASRKTAEISGGKE